jgi:hypothetical protein
MRIPQGHCNRFVSHQLFHCCEIHACHYQPTRKRMPQVVKREIKERCPSYRCRECCRDVSVRHSLMCQKDIGRRVAVDPNGLERFCQECRHGNTARLSIFSIRSLRRNELMLEIYMLPTQGEEFRLPKACVKRSNDDRPQIRSTVDQKAHFFFLGQKTCSPVVFPKQANVLHGIFIGLAPFHGHREQILQKCQLPVDCDFTASIVFPKPFVLFNRYCSAWGSSMSREECGHTW